MPKPKQKEAEPQTGATAEAVTETVQQIPFSELHPFEGHPFKVRDDEAMTETVESIKMVGITNPLIVRPDPDGGYEMISGHRRHHAAELAGLDTLPVIVRELDDDAAVIMMVDSNIQRENILPSERAYAYKIKDFERVLNKYGVDYAIRKDVSQEPPRFMVFFKAKDADVLTAAFKEYSVTT